MSFRYFENAGYREVDGIHKARLLLVEPQHLFAEALTLLLKRRFQVELLSGDEASACHDIIVIDEDAASRACIDALLSSNDGKVPICLLAWAPSQLKSSEPIFSFSKEMAAEDFIAAITRIAQQAQYASGASILHLAPQFDQIGVSSTFQFATPGATAGGDWYDVLPSHGRMAFVIGDVAGHGADAALTAGMLRRLIGKMLLQNEDPSTILSRANASILKRKMSHATVLCGYVDPRSHEIVYATEVFSLNETTRRA
jgi:hypothetical protein